MKSVVCGEYICNISWHTLELLTPSKQSVNSTEHLTNTSDQGNFFTVTVYPTRMAIFIMIMHHVTRNGSPLKDSRNRISLFQWPAQSPNPCCIHAILKAKEVQRNYTTRPSVINTQIPMSYLYKSGFSSWRCRTVWWQVQQPS